MVLVILKYKRYVPFEMKQSCVIAFLTLSICSCLDNTTSSRKIEKAISTDSVVPDRFETRDDTANFNIDKGNLATKVLTLRVSFAAISCPCAQWFESKYSNNWDNRRTFYLEPADPTLINADTLFDGTNLPVIISVTGQFYEKPGYPKNYRPAKGDPAPARVFRYMGIKIIKLGGSR